MYIPGSHVCAGPNEGFKLGEKKSLSWVVSFFSPSARKCALDENQSSGNGPRLGGGEANGPNPILRVAKEEGKRGH